MIARLLWPAATGLLLTGLAACSGGGGSQTASPEPVRAAGMLSQASDSQALEESIKQGLKQAFDSDNSLAAIGGAGRQIELFAVETGATADSSGAEGGSFSETYTVEAGVGEADILKYDGDILYSAHYRYICQGCDQPADEAPVHYTVGWQININQTDPANAGLEKLAQLDLEENLRVQGLYLPAPGNLVVIQSTAYYGTCGVGWSQPWYWEAQRTVVTFYDTSNPAQPQQTDRLELDGAYTASRRVDGNIYLISRYTPSLEVEPHYFSASGEELSEVETSIDEIALADLTPALSHNGSADSLFEPTDCYIPTDSEEVPDSASITTISVIPASNPGAIQSSCYTGEAYGMYMSTEALYLTSQRYEYTEISSADFSIIHKFALDGNSVDYRGSAELPGTLGHGEQLDFRLSEHEGLLRVVTSEYDYSAFPPDFFEPASEESTADSIDHRITVLRESSSAVALETVSTLPNDSQPAEIGKPDERLYGVRFFGERAYLVTFQQIDPLYVIDLSDAENPAIAGELEVPGVADFLHPVSDQLLLTLGRSVELVSLDEGSAPLALFQGLKLELFDVSDITAPASLSSIEIGDRGTFSEAQYNRHAFSYQAEFTGSGSNDRFAIPVDVYQNAGSGSGPETFWNSYWLNSGLQLFEITSPHDASSAELRAQGSMITHSRADEQGYPSYSGQRRSIFHDDAVYLISGPNAWSAYWADPSAVNSF